MKKYLLLFVLPLIFSCSIDDGDDFCKDLNADYNQAIEDADGNENLIRQIDQQYSILLTDSGCQ